MEKDCQSALRRLKQSVRHLKRGKQCSANTVYSTCVELLSFTEGNVGQRKDYVREVLNCNDTPSSEESKAGGSEVDSTNTQVKVTKAVRKLFGGKVLAVDKIRHEYLKSLDVVVMFWLTCLWSIA